MARVPMDELCAAVMRGEIADAKTICAVMMAAQICDKRDRGC